MDKGNKKSKREWHLYSALAVTAILTFVGINFFTGTPQMLGAAFAALVGTYLFVSTEWKSQPVAVHMWVVIISSVAMVIVVVGFAVLNSLKLFSKSNRPSITE